MSKRFGAWMWWKLFSVVVFCLSLSVLWLFWQVSARVGVNALAWSTAFGRTAQRSVVSLAPELLVGFVSGRTRPVGELRYLILGKDEVPGSNRPVILTDTIILVTYRPQEGVVRLLSLPRDIYLPELGFKINTLYSESMQRGERSPGLYTKNVLSEKLGVPIAGVLEVSLTDVEEIVDMVGGVELEVPRTFADTQYPRSGVDVTKVTDPRVLYETVSFEAGQQTLTGERAGKYIRTRHADVLSEAGDAARNRRQQQVIEALVRKVADPQFIEKPALIGQLYNWYALRYQQTVSLTQLGRVIGTLEQVQKVPKLEKVFLPVTDLPRATDSATLFVHPAVPKYRQWVYEAVDPTWEQVRIFVREKGL